MLCSECVKTLYSNLSGEAKTIIVALFQYHGDKIMLNQGQIIKLTGLSTSITRDALNELRGAMMVTMTVKGRGNCYRLKDYVLADDMVGMMEAGAMAAEEVGA